MNIILVGAPGSGKGTQAKTLASHYQIPHISTGDMLRDEQESGSELGLHIKSLIDGGNFVSDELIIRLVKERIAKPDCANGFILDGFPRTLKQAQVMQEEGIEVDHVVELVVPFQLIVTRITGRLVHKASGRVYHKTFNKPAVEWKDDVTGEDLYVREDDKEEIVLERLSTYQAKTQPVLDFYKELAERTGSVRYHTVDGVGDVDEIPNRIYNAISC